MTLTPVRIRNGDVELSTLVSDGTGSPVVILHGLAGSSQEFVPTAEALGENRVILVDARGHGKSTRRPTDVSRDAHVSDVLRVIDELVGEPVAVVGQSMGGHTALLAAATRPDRFERLVLLEAGVGGDGTAESRDQLVSFFDSWPVPFPNERAAAEFLGTEPLAQAWLADLERHDDGLRARFDADILGATLSHLDERPRWAEWESVSTPSLAVFAENGMFGPAAKDEFVSRGPNVHRADIPAASHDAHLDAFTTWERLLRAFLA
jgi:pimeloyl-ACP methyl ester carboxylesterase